ncbi:class I SAM-dependent methyltransferase [Candidatus Collierbacteria bacterium]|nr:class I SAM-dependent methyltransferase [Candidatus Collierbacteria bacterium]
MSNLLKEILALKHTPWYRWHPELAMRYLPMVEWIKVKGQGLRAKGKKELTILEVGSGGLGITPYLKLPVTGVDVEFKPPFHPNLIRVVGKAEKLDFADKSFDMVISSDMLEHLSPGVREKSIFEMIRVSKSGVVIGAPCGSEASRHDQELRHEYLKTHKTEFTFLKEQVEYGLPDKTDIIAFIDKASKRLDRKIKLTVSGNENMLTRKFLMRGWISSNFWVNVFFRKILLPFIPLLMLLERPPFYRQIFFVEIENNE